MPPANSVLLAVSFVYEAALAAAEARPQPQARC
jgi:hypothetical protein